MWHQAPLSHSVDGTNRSNGCCDQAIFGDHGYHGRGYGLKAAGVLAALEKFEMLFDLKLGRLLFSAAEQTSRVLQAKDTAVQEAVSAVNATRAFYQRQRQDDAFDTFYENTVAQAQTLPIGEPKLPRYRKPPKRFGGSEPHKFSKPKEFFRQQYFAACDLLIQELLDRFEQKDLM